MTWNIDKTHSEVGFSVRHMMISNVRGKFQRFDAELELDPKNLEAAKLKATIETASIDTGVEQRDNHLRSADFFDSEQHPSMVFTSTKGARKDESIDFAGTASRHEHEHEIFAGRSEDQKIGRSRIIGRCRDRRVSGPARTRKAVARP